MMDDLTNTGSLCLVVRTDRNAQGVGSMVTRFGFLDPETITDVLHDPANARVPVAVLRVLAGGRMPLTGLGSHRPNHRG